MTKKQRQNVFNIYIYRVCVSKYSQQTLVTSILEGTAKHYGQVWGIEFYWKFKKNIYNLKSLFLWAFILVETKSSWFFIFVLLNIKTLSFCFIINNMILSVKFFSDFTFFMVTFLTKNIKHLFKIVDTINLRLLFSILL